MYTPVNPYCSLSELIQELKMKPSDVAEKPALKDELLRAIDRGSRWVDNYTQRDYFFHDFSQAPYVFDNFNENVLGWDIFFPFKPIIGLTKLTLGADEDSGTELIANKDYYNDSNRIYLLRSSTMFVQNVDIPHDGAGAIRVGPGKGGWCLSRPDRLLFVRGTAGNPQAKLYQMTATGDAAAQTDAWEISSYSTPPALYWTMKKVGTVVTVQVTLDSFGAQVVAKGTGTAGTPQVVELCEVDGSGFKGLVSINYSADSASANTLAVTPNTPAVLDSSSITLNLEGKIRESARLVAASFSGHNRKEIAGLDGETVDITDRKIPDTVYKMLGRQNPILV